MTQTARKHAWLHSIKPASRQMAGVISVEIAVMLSWTLLANSLLGLLSGGSLLTAPVCYILAVAILAWLEHTGSTRRLNCPLQAFGLALITLDGNRPGQWRIFLRLSLLTPLVLLFGVAFIRLRRRDCKLLQFLSGTRLVPLDASMDPRIPADVLNDRHLAMKRVLGYMLSSVAVAAIILLLPHGSGQASRRHGSGPQGLPGEEQELLAAYLEMAALYPDSIEFHVRLASLYYRNGMEADLENALEAIRRIDADHPMLLLGEDLSVDFSDISAESGILPVPEQPVEADSAAEADSSLSVPDSAGSAEALPLPDSLPAIQAEDVDPSQPAAEPGSEVLEDAPETPPAVDGEFPREKDGGGIPPSDSGELPPADPPPPD